MRQPLVAGNWKLNGTRTSAVELAEAVARGCASFSIDTLVCPSFVHLADVCKSVGSLDGAQQLGVGAQDCSEQAGGAFTGEVSAGMLADIGVSHVIVGHSERRQFYADTNERVAAKFDQAQSAGLIPVLCVGESASERESGTTREVVGAQLKTVIEQAGVAALGQAVLAYEPVWAIGTGLTASPEQAQEIHQWLREQVAGYDANVANGLRILYGGSVKPANAAELFGQADIDGGLIGGAALDPDDFIAICAAAAAPG